MTLWLVGMMGSGKTTAGQKAAARIGVPFDDTDVVVAQRMGCSVAQLWGELGEAAFRDMEKVAIAGLAGKEGIVATGGGAVLSPDNRDAMTGSGVVVWLRASPSVLSRRVGSSSGRPLLSDDGNEETLAAHLEEREELYALVADHEIATDTLDVMEVSAAIEAVWNA